MIGSGKRPRAAWGGFPLTELTVFAALILAAFGFAWWGSERGIAAAAAGTALGCLAGLELSLREHLAGYRSHCLLLAVPPAALAALAIGLLVPGLPAATVAFATAFALAGWQLRRVFLARSGTTYAAFRRVGTPPAK